MQVHIDPSAKFLVSYDASCEAGQGREDMRLARILVLAAAVVGSSAFQRARVGGGQAIHSWETETPTNIKPTRAFRRRTATGQNSALAPSA